MRGRVKTRRNSTTLGTSFAKELSFKTVIAWSRLRCRHFRNQRAVFRVEIELCTAGEHDLSQACISRVLRPFTMTVEAHPSTSIGGDSILASVALLEGVNFECRSTS
jgi:hypothetical protein